MPLEMWFRDDLKNILFAINVASATAARYSDEAATVAYRQGFQEALGAVALSLGIPPTEIVPAKPGGNGHEMTRR